VQTLQSVRPPCRTTFSRRTVRRAFAGQPTACPMMSRGNRLDKASLPAAAGQDKPVPVGVRDGDAPVVLIRITRGYLGSDRHEPDSRNRGGAVRRAYTYCGQHPASDSACCAFLWCPLRTRRSRLCIRRLRWRWRAGSSPSCAVVRAPGRDDLAGVWQPGMDRPESAAGPWCARCAGRGLLGG